jgi:hypothetical protein
MGPFRGQRSYRLRFVGVHGDRESEAGFNFIGNTYIPVFGSVLIERLIRNIIKKKKRWI